MCEGGPRCPKKREGCTDRGCSPGHRVAWLTHSACLFLGEPFWARQFILRLHMTINVMGLSGGFNEIRCMKTWQTFTQPVSN